LNFFKLDNDIDRCVVAHCDQHAIKMSCEYAQLLSSAHRVLDGEPYIAKSKAGRSIKRFKLDRPVYEAAHINHPTTIWCRSSSSNYMHLFEHWVKLMEEYSYRYNKIHKCSELIGALSNLPNNILDDDYSDPPQAMPDQYKCNDVVAAYRDFYINDKLFARYTRRDKPEWLNGRATDL
jgi:hypothetical protein